MTPASPATPASPIKKTKKKKTTNKENIENMETTSNLKRRRDSGEGAAKKCVGDRPALRTHLEGPSNAYPQMQLSPNKFQATYRSWLLFRHSPYHHLPYHFRQCSLPLSPYNPHNIHNPHYHHHNLPYQQINLISKYPNSIPSCKKLVPTK